MFSSSMFRAARVVGSKISTNRATAGKVVTGVALTAAGFATFAANATQPSICDADYGKLRKEIEAMVDADEAKREDGTSMAGTLVRLGWHCSGTYSAKDKTGGSNGSTMRMAPEATWGANAGLGSARSFLEPLKEKYNMTYADLYTFASVVAVEKMGGPKIPWRSGRTDSAVGTTVPDGRLPDADKGCPKATSGHIRDIFYRMGFNDREIVALCGAHAIGRCHTDASGYWGPWNFSETSFSNEYFRLLLEEKWTIKRTHEGKEWKGPQQFEDPTGKMMMLPSDMVIIQDPEFRKYAEMYTKDEALFFKDFSAAFSKLLELGVVFPWGATRV